MSGMKLTDILDYWLDGDIIHESKEETRAGDVYVDKRNGEIFLVLKPLHAQGVGRKWDWCRISILSLIMESLTWVRLKLLHGW